MSDWISLAGSLFVLTAIAGVFVWWMPEAAMRVSHLLLVRAMALRAARQAYAEKWEELWKQ